MSFCKKKNENFFTKTRKKTKISVFFESSLVKRTVSPKSKHNQKPNLQPSKTNGPLAKAFAVASGQKRPKTTRAPPSPSSSPKPSSVSTEVEHSTNNGRLVTSDVEHSTTNPSPQNPEQTPEFQKT
jgi:hypothetical protein